MKTVMRWFGRGLRNGLVAIGALVFSGGILALANYVATQGSGTNFGSVIVSTVHYAQMMLCDLTTPSQCAAVSAGGAVKVDNSAVTQPTNLTQVAGSSVATAATGIPKVGLTDGTGTAVTSLTGSGHTAVDVVINDASNNRLSGLVTGTFGTPSTQVVSTQNNDPCSYANKSSASISISSSTTTQLVALSNGLAIYACGFSLTIAPSGTTADSIQFEYGTGSTCGTGTTALTGTYGGGDLTTATAVVPISYGGGADTVFKTPTSNALCALTAGGTVNIQGVLTYVQQ